MLFAVFAKYLINPSNSKLESYGTKNVIIFMLLRSSWLIVSIYSALKRKAATYVAASF